MFVARVKITNNEGQEYTYNVNVNNMYISSLNEEILDAIYLSIEENKLKGNIRVVVDIEKETNFFNGEFYNHDEFIIDTSKIWYNEDGSINRQESELIITNLN